MTIRAGVARRALLGGMAGFPLGHSAIGAPAAGPAELRIASPDRRVVLTLDPLAHRWSVDIDGRQVIAPSPLALLLRDGTRLGPGSRLRRHATRDARGAWKPPYGIRSVYRDDFRELVAEFEHGRLGIGFAIIARAYDTGVAIRFRLLRAPSGALELSGEETEIRLPPEAVVYASRDEGEYQRTVQTGIAPEPEPALTASSDAGPLADLPLTVLLPGGAALAILESDRLGYPRAMIRSTDTGIVTRLMRYPGRATGYSGPGDTAAEDTFSLTLPADTPWRVVLAGPSVGALVERQDLVTTLATPNRLGDVRWVRPGRVMRITGYTTAAGLATVDFAAERKLDYVLWDAHWYGDGTDPSDATYPIPAIDIRRVIEHARSKSIGMLLYVDRVPAMRQLDAIVRTYRAWGVAGIKFGFVWEGRQSDVDFIYRLVETCGRAGLLVNLHDNLRPAGLERTLPNYISLEGVRGNEHFPTATHNCTLPFTRGLAGPMDYTICYDHARSRTTNAHQLALAAIYYDPLTVLYWYDSPAKYAGRKLPELRFFDECPTSWDETVVLSGRIGEHIAVARRHGTRWFLGAITNEAARRLSLDLGFLENGRWRARRFADGAADARPRATPVVLSDREVMPAERLELELAPSGGQAVIFERI